MLPVGSYGFDAHSLLFSMSDLFVLKLLKLTRGSGRAFIGLWSTPCKLKHNMLVAQGPEELFIACPLSP